jgi:hypothetical protein
VKVWCLSHQLSRVFYWEIEMQISTAAQRTMSTREIAELLEKQHSHIKVSAERLAQKGIFGLRKTPYVDPQNKQTYTEYLLNKRDSFILVAQVSPQHIGVAIDAWGRTQQSLDELIAALDAFDVPEECEGMHVYAIKNTVTGAIKLGISRDPQARLRQLQTGNDCRLELIATRPAVNRFADERALHVKHADYRISGEWFDLPASQATLGA